MHQRPNHASSAVCMTSVSTNSAPSLPRATSAADVSFVTRESARICGLSIRKLSDKSQKHIRRFLPSDPEMMKGALLTHHAATGPLSRGVRLIDHVRMWITARTTPEAPVACGAVGPTPPSLLEAKCAEDIFHDAGVCPNCWFVNPQTIG